MGTPNETAGLPIRKLRQRKLIRKKIISILKGKTAAGDRVHDNESTATWEEELAIGPVILIYPRSEPAEEFAVAPKELKRTLEVAIECIAQGPESSDEKSNGPSLSDILDDLTHEVECELSRDDTLGDTASDIILTNTEFEFESRGAVPFGSARLLYTVTYYTLTPENLAKQVGVAALKKLDVDWKVGHDDDAPDTETEANDSIDIPQT